MLGPKYDPKNSFCNDYNYDVCYDELNNIKLKELINAPSKKLIDSPHISDCADRQPM